MIRIGSADGISRAGPAKRQAPETSRTANTGDLPVNALRGIVRPMSDQTRPDFADTLEGQIIIEMVGEGKTLIAACAAVGQNYTDVFRKIRENPKFKDLMEEARSSGYEVLAEECLAIADDASNDTIETERGEKPNKEWMQRSKLRVETRLKLLAKWHPRKYGEKLEIEQKTANIQIPVSDDPIAAQRAYEQLMKGE